ncbi:hypothetical protein JL2886_01862 [Phaeobacter gallaeciensis]|uniref:Uncharacterized protein n=1 Tax=Phaeobacter gallaeciensis TaxID=60890 RepID=A0A1B0ZRJ3_9RHOB|nr:hypothetical protein JL2886_01862 [Phaeobacter gallaeciensis]
MRIPDFVIECLGGHGSSPVLYWNSWLWAGLQPYRRARTVRAAP